MAAYRRTLFAAGAGTTSKSAEVLNVRTARQKRACISTAPEMILLPVAG
jgi:hypothetical protein